MILDTTYVLPLVGIAVNEDILSKDIVEITSVKISLISIFELQAKAVNLGIPTKKVSEGLDALMDETIVIPFYTPEIIEFASSLRSLLNDYIDCLIVATAVALKEDLITEDSKVMKNRRFIKEKYKINVLNYKEIVSGKSK